MRGLVIILSMFVMSLSFAETFYVKSLKAKMFSEPSLVSKVVKELKRGDAVEVLKSKGNWYYVDYKGVKGWIYSLLVGKDKPMGKVSLIFDEKKSEVIRARERSSSNITAAAARGLTGDFRRRNKGKYVSDYISLRKMESIEITDEEIEKFSEVLR